MRNQLYHVLVTMAFFSCLVFGIRKKKDQPFMLFCFFHFGIVITSELSTFVTQHLHIITLPSYFLTWEKKESIKYFLWHRIYQIFNRRNIFLFIYSTSLSVPAKLHNVDFYFMENSKVQKCR